MGPTRTLEVPVKDGVRDDIEYAVGWFTTPDLCPSGSSMGSIMPSRRSFSFMVRERYALARRAEVREMDSGLNEVPNSRILEGKDSILHTAIQNNAEESSS